jgi:hypothetical protein
VACNNAAVPPLPLPLPPDDPNPRPNAAGLVPLPCREAGPLRPVHPDYCRRQRQFVTPRVRATLLAASEAFAARHPGRVVRYMEASWPSGERPMPPHLSHGDGREIDIVLFYEDRSGRPKRQPTASGYGGFEPPRREAERVCQGVASTHSFPDPPPTRAWRLDEAASADPMRLLLADRRVRRIFIEPHLKGRLGFVADARVRFAGCQAARHDDHLHVDFY